MSSLDNNKAFLAIGGTIAGAGIASAIASLIVPIVPIVGGVVTALGLKLSGAIDRPETVLIDPTKPRGGRP